MPSEAQGLSLVVAVSGANLKKRATGVVLVRTNTALLIGYSDDRQQPGDAALEVEKLADYPMEYGY